MSHIRCGCCGKRLDDCACPREESWLEKEYAKAEAADSFDLCPSCGDKDPHVLCLTCGVCFKYCHPETDHMEDDLPQFRPSATDTRAQRTK